VGQSCGPKKPEFPADRRREIARKLSDAKNFKFPVVRDILWYKNNK
jgi:hypothetical protein